VVEVRSVQDDLVVALAELYLDTDVRCALPRVAERIVRSGLPAHRLDSLWRSQVTPVVHWNLKSTAGEWAGFDRHWLLHEVTRRAGKHGLETWPLLGPVVHRFRAHRAEREYRFAQVLADRLMQLPEVERPRRVALWQAIFHVYYSVDIEPAPAGCAYDASVRFSHRLARQLIERQRLDPGELVEEFRAICDLLSELLSTEQHKRTAEAHVAAWLERLGA
jgi:hypothetical protein